MVGVIKDKSYIFFRYIWVKVVHVLQFGDCELVVHMTMMKKQFLANQIKQKKTTKLKKEDN